MVIQKSPYIHRFRSAKAMYPSKNPSAQYNVSVINGERMRFIGPNETKLSHR
jgi:hypothetical protein